MEGHIVKEFSQLRVLPQTTTNTNTTRGSATDNRRSLITESLGSSRDDPNSTEDSIRMDALAQDLKYALEESTKVEAGRGMSEQKAVKGAATDNKCGGKRRVWRRRCKSTSNLAVVGNAGRTSSTTKPKAMLEVSGSTASNASVITAGPSNTMTTTQNYSDESGMHCYFLCYE